MEDQLRKQKQAHMAKLRDEFLDNTSSYQLKSKVLTIALSEGEQWLKKAPDFLKEEINKAGAGVGAGAATAGVGLLGFALAPFTFGASLVVAGAAVAVTAGTSAAVIETLKMKVRKDNERVWGEHLERVKRVNALIEDVNSTVAKVNMIADQIVVYAKMINKEIYETISAMFKEVLARLVTVEALVVRDAMPDGRSEISFALRQMAGEVATRSTRVCPQKEALKKILDNTDDFLRLLLKLPYP